LGEGVDPREAFAVIHGYDVGLCYDAMFSW
jgi:hypothetical protein